MTYTRFDSPVCFRDGCDLPRITEQSKYCTFHYYGRIRPNPLRLLCPTCEGHGTVRHNDKYCDADQLITNLCYFFGAGNASFDPVKFRRAAMGSKEIEAAEKALTDMAGHVLTHAAEFPDSYDCIGGEGLISKAKAALKED